MAQTEATAQAAETKKASDKIDFKMITFSLAGKEYGIDIMSVKEIAKAGRFTYVPNAAPFVRGVYNLRGDIISVIDLRTFFHLPSERKVEDALESLLILKLEEHVFGVIVDAIDKVVGISAAAIQPPHPIFGDINVKYIKGIVENSGKLYIILDVDKIFAPAKVEEEGSRPPAHEDGRRAEVAIASSSGGVEDMAAAFIRESLAALRGFYISAVNEAWFSGRYAEWRAQRGADVQIHDPQEAEAFLEGFWSPASGRLWEQDYLDATMALFPQNESKNINVWNPGCGKGHETWSLAIGLRRSYPEARIKVWANDSDLLAISMAPNMIFPENVPALYQEYLMKGRNGQTFIQAIRDSIFFEFHDVLNSNPLPPLDMIFCRDLLSLLAPVDQSRLLDDFYEKLKPAGILILGANEAPGGGWTPIGSGAVRAFRKE
ncbi:MAG TPA: chemotaxis protein CheW [Rectinemataceae bacterium]|nr:chemotaxis protein CheW [Rectinemataceae bacterium]